MSFPKKLNLEQYFSSPVWWADETKFVKKLNKASDKYIKDAQKISSICNRVMGARVC
jgi:hypothetical protein